MPNFKRPTNNDKVEQAAKLAALKSMAGYPVRQKLASGEEQFFRARPDVGGMATELNDIILNPYSQLKDNEKLAVAKNEATRLYLEQNQIKPNFNLTDKQTQFFNTIQEGKPYSQDQNDIKSTLISRILTGDPSAQDVTPEQEEYADKVRRQMGLD